jgi:hypothetical protein
MRIIQTSVGRKTQSSVFWDVMPCSPLIAYQLFGGTCLFCLQGQRMSLALLATYFRTGFSHVSLKHQLTFNGLHDIITQKIQLLLTFAVRTSNSEGKMQFI